MRRVYDCIYFIIITVLPAIYCLCYTKVKSNILLAGENFAISVDIRLLFILCTLISSIFILVMLYLTGRFSADSFKRKCIIAALLIVHLLIGYVAPYVIDYFQFMEVAGNLITVLLLNFMPVTLKMRSHNHGAAKSTK